MTHVRAFDDLPRPAVLLVATLFGSASACGGGTDGAPQDATDASADTTTSDVRADTARDGDASAALDAPDALDAADAIDATADVDAAPSGKLLFLGDFEPGDLSQWPGVEQCAKGRISVYSSVTPGGDPAPRQGKYAAHYHVLDSDVAPCTSTDNPRAQLSTDVSLFAPGDEVWEFWSMYVPTSFPAVASDKWVLFQEDYGPPWDGPPQIGWDILPVGGVLSFVMNRGAQYGVDTAWHAPIVEGAWVDFLVHKKFSNTTTGGGFVEAWVGGKPLSFAPCGGCATLEMQTMHSTQTSLAFFQNLYRAAGTAPTADLYFDAVRIGTTRAIVELP